MNHYLTCFYQGNERLSLWFGNPNYTGAWLVMLAVASGALFWCFRRRVWLGAAIAAVAAFPCYVAVGMTYSRGAYLAVAAALGGLALLRSFSCWKNRRAPHACSLWARIGAAWLPLAFFLATLCSLPSGGKRLDSIRDVNEDLSIAHRLHLWRGGAMMISQYPRYGVGESPGKLYSLFYQPLGKEEKYETFLSDFLTLAATWGLLVAGEVLALALLPVFLGLALWKRYDDELALQLAAALGGYLVVGLFNTCMRSTTVQCTCISLAAMIYLRRGWWLWHHTRKTSKEPGGLPQGAGRTFGLVALLAPLTALAVCGAVYALGRHFSARWYFTTTPGVLECGGTASFQLHPRIPNGTRIEYFCEDPLKGLRSELLPLVAEGYEIHVWTNPGGVGGVRTIARLLETVGAERASGQRWLVAATGNAANAALGAVKTLPPERQPDGVILQHALLRHPFPELSLEGWSWERPVKLIPLDEPDKKTLANLKLSFPRLQCHPADTTVLNAVNAPDEE
ncbi:MAG: O-antigen ligase family protein [Victivallales bacterium]|nr:O-antigen ligase family protein [Victivallales bacterium]